MAPPATTMVSLALGIDDGYRRAGRDAGDVCRTPARSTHAGQAVASCRTKASWPDPADELAVSRRAQLLRLVRPLPPRLLTDPLPGRSGRYRHSSSDARVHLDRSNDENGWSV